MGSKRLPRRCAVWPNVGIRVMRSPPSTMGLMSTSGFHCLCVPGGMFFNNRWVYFAFIINWDAEAATDPATVTAFLSATSEALTRVFNALSA